MDEWHMPPARLRHDFSIVLALLISAGALESWGQAPPPPQQPTDYAARVDTTAIRTRLEQLTGLKPIDTPNGPLTVTST
jgi:hypothetical protein